MTALRRKPVHRGHPMKPIDCPSRCDICGQARNKGNHTKCSAERQARPQENAS